MLLISDDNINLLSCVVQRQVGPGRLYTLVFSWRFFLLSLKSVENLVALLWIKQIKENKLQFVSSTLKERCL